MRYQVLDSWRGICACLVVLYHFPANNIIRDLPFFANAFLFVDFFFVLSGFVIFASYQQRLTSKAISIPKFMALRAGRVYPLHFFMLMVFVLTELAFFQIIPQFSADGRAAFSDKTSVESLISNIFLVHSLGLHDSTTWNGPSWSISTEYYTYLIFALSLIALKRQWFNLAKVAVIAGPIAIFFLVGHIETTYDFGIVRCVYGFCLGALVYNWISKKIQPNRLAQWLARQGNTIEFATLLFLIICVSYFGHSAPSILTPYLFALTIYIFSFEAGFISKALKTRPFLYIGTLSYSIYLVHSYIQSRLINVTQLFDKLTSAENFVVHLTAFGTEERIGSNQLHGLLFYLFMLAIVIIASHFTYKFIEIPGQRWTKKWLSPKTNTLN